MYKRKENENCMVSQRQANARSGGRKRTERAIMKAKRAGKSPKTDKTLAGMMDRLYGTRFVERYHSKETK